MWCRYFYLGKDFLICCMGCGLDCAGWFVTITIMDTLTPIPTEQLYIDLTSPLCKYPVLNEVLAVKDVGTIKPNMYAPFYC